MSSEGTVPRESGGEVCPKTSQVDRRGPGWGSAAVWTLGVLPDLHAFDDDLLISMHSDPSILPLNFPLALRAAIVLSFSL